MKAARAEAAVERLTAQYERQKELVTLEAQRSMDLATAKIAAQLPGGGSGAVPVGSRGGAVRFQAPEQLRGGGLGAVRGR